MILIVRLCHTSVLFWLNDMNFKLRYVGHMRVPRQITDKYSTILARSSYRSLELRQAYINDTDRLAMWCLLSSLLGDGMPSGVEASVLEYRQVGEHDDDWSTVLDSRNNWVEPGFLHLVLSGSCVVRCGKTERAFKRGDVFLLNPNVPHEVPSKTRCMTYTVVVPAHEVLRKIR